MQSAMSWHPYAETFPLIEGDEFEKMVASVKRTKGNKSKPCYFRVVAGQKQGLDGRNREAACKAAGVKCTWEKVTVADADVEEFIDRHNERRRHMTPEQREARVMLLRAQGRSTREIAEKVNASQSTVINDLRAAGEQNCSPEGGISPEIVGRDGKKYKSTQEPGEAHEGPILCPRCTRFGVETPSPERGGCEKCRQAREKDAKRANRPGKRQGAQRNGQPLFDWKAFNGDFGALGRQIDKLGRLYGVKDSAPAEALHDKLKAFKNQFTDWHSSLVRPTPKKGR